MQKSRIEQSLIDYSGHPSLHNPTQKRLIGEDMSESCQCCDESLMMRFRHQKAQGFTIIEAIIAVAILGVGILAMANMQIVAMSTNSIARHITESTIIAQTKLEEMMALAVDHADMKNSESPEVVDTIYSLEWTVAPDILTAPDATRRTITIRVKWRDFGIFTKTTELKCLKTQALSL